VILGLDRLVCAALYTARADLNRNLLWHGARRSGFVDKHSGGILVPEGVGGQQLVDLFQKQAERFGAHIELDTATMVDLSTRPFRVHTYNSKYTSDSLIVTTGATPIHLEVPGERELTGGSPTAPVMVGSLGQGCRSSWWW
jgi:thioredoxin reductase (NADPH)